MYVCIFCGDINDVYVFNDLLRVYVFVGVFKGVCMYVYIFFRLK